MQWINHIIENLKWTIKRMLCVCACLHCSQPPEKMANFLLSSFKTCYFIWKEKKPVFNSEILWLCFTMMLMLWIFSTHIEHILHHFFSASLCFSSFHIFLWPRTLNHISFEHSFDVFFLLRVFSVCVLGTFAHSRTFDLVSSVCCGFHQHFSAVHFISFRFYSSTLILLYSSSFLIQLLSSCVVIIQQHCWGFGGFFLLSNISTL